MMPGQHEDGKSARPRFTKLAKTKSAGSKVVKMTPNLSQLSYSKKGGKDKTITRFII